MSLLLRVWNHQRVELTSFKLHFYGSWSCTPHPFFLLIIEKISLDAMVYFQNTFFWETYVLLLFKFNQQAILSMACTYTEIFNNLFFRFFRNLCNILHECDSSATPENPGTNEGVAVILYHQNHDFGKYFCKLYISKHYLWWVSNAIFFFLPVSFCLRVLTFYHNVFFFISNLAFCYLWPVSDFLSLNN